MQEVGLERSPEDKMMPNVWQERKGTRYTTKIRVGRIEQLEMCLG